MPEEAKGWFILPTGNVYEDGRLCFGPELLRSSSIMGATKSNIDLFYATPWNNDLLEDRERTVKMFRFSEADNTQLDPLGRDLGARGGRRRRSRPRGEAVNPETSTLNHTSTLNPQP